MENFVCYFVDDKLNQKLIPEDIDFVRRLGNRGNKSRPILLGLRTYRTKLLILQNARKLKGTKLYIDHDFPQDVQQKRKLLKTEMMEARRSGKYAVLKYDRLIMQDNNYRMKDNHTENKKRLLSMSPAKCDSDLGLKKNKSEMDKNKAKQNLERFSFRSRSTSESNICGGKDSQSGSRKKGDATS